MAHSYSQTIDSMYDRFVRFRTACMVSIDAIPEDLRQTIPGGLRNNIHWQAGHLATVQASLLYLRCGVEPPLEKRWFDSFAKGTSPAGWNEFTPDFAGTRSQLELMIDRSRADLPALHGRDYVEPITVTGNETLRTFVEALSFLTIHEALHLGTINTMRRLLGAP